MADQDTKFKEKVEEQLDKSLKKGEIDKATHKKLKKALKAAKTAGSFAADVLMGGKGFLKTLGKAKGIKWKAAGGIIGIAITLIEAGPCPWTSVLLALVNKKYADSMMDDAPKAIQDKILKLKKKLGTVVSKCTRQANGNLAPQDINKAFVSDLKKVPGVGDALARSIILEADNLSFHTPWELLRVKGASHKIIDALLENGFYFGVSGAGHFGIDELAADMPKAVKLYYEFGNSGAPLVEASFSLHHCGDLNEAENQLERSELPEDKRLALRLVDEEGRTVGYRTAGGDALTIIDLTAEIKASKRNLEIVSYRDRSYVRRPANDDTSDNLSALPIERYYK